MRAEGRRQNLYPTGTGFVLLSNKLASAGSYRAANERRLDFGSCIRHTRPIEMLKAAKAAGQITHAHGNPVRPLTVVDDNDNRVTLADSDAMPETEIP